MSFHRRRRSALLVALALAVGLSATALGAPAGQTSDVPTPTSSSSPEGIVAGPTGALWFTELNAGKVAEINPTTDTISEFATPTAASGPLGIAMGSDGTIWFTEWAVSKIAEINPVSGVISEFATPTPGSFPVAVAAGPNGSIWFTESAVSKIAELDPATHAITEFPTPTPSSLPFGISAGPDGNVWFTEKGASKIGQINVTTDAISEFPTPTPSSQPNEIAAGPSGSLWFTELAADKVAEIDPTSHAITEVPLAASTGPLVIATGPDGNIWFTEGTANQIGQINPVTHAVNTFPAPTASSAPTGIAAGADGNLWFTETSAARIGMIGAGAPAASASAPVATGNAQPGGVVSCEGETWSNWAGLQPSATALGFDGYRWLLDGSPIAGAASVGYTPVAGDVGHQLACVVTVTYPLLRTTTAAGSAAVTVYPDLGAALGAIQTTGPAASLTIACQGLPSQTCAGPLGLTAHVTTRSGKTVAVAALARTSKRKPGVTMLETVASGSYSVAAGASVTVDLKLSSAGKKILDRFYRLPTTLSIGGTTPITAAATFSYGRIHVSPIYTWAFSPRGSVADELTLKHLPPASHVTLICHGGGCPFTRRTFASPGSGKLVLAAALHKRRLHPGATLDVEISAPGDVGEVVVFAVKSSSQPSESFRCLPPGARSPTRCA